MKHYKNDIKPFIFIFLFLTGYTEFIKSTANMRDIVIIADVRNKIGKNRRFDIMTGKLITGIYTEVPIAVSPSIWNQFIQKRNSFYQKIKQSDSAEYNSYHLYELVNEHLNDMPQKNVSETELKNAINKQLFNKQTAIGALWNQIKDKSRYDDNFICFSTPFSNKQWSVYILPSFVLLVPETYKQKIKKQIQHKLKDLETASNKLNIGLDELILGLKINTLEKKEFSDEYDLPKAKRSIILDTKTIEDDLHKIFVTKKDLGLPNMSNVFSRSKLLEYIPHTWNIYLSGHGGYKGKSLELAKQQQMLRALHEKIGHIHTTLTPYTIQKFDEKYRNDLYKMMKLEKDMQRLINNSPMGRVAGMLIEQFKRLLSFAERNIDVSFLHYSTCFAAGEKLNLIYTTHGLTDTYSFPISASVITDITTKSSSPKISFKNATYDIKTNGLIRIEPKKLLKLSEFYQALRKKNILWDTLVDLVNINKSNIPGIRFPGTHWLSVAKLDRVVNLTRIRASIATAKGSITLYLEHMDESKKKIKLTNYIILHTPYMGFKINIKTPIVNPEWSWLQLTAISLLSSQAGQPTNYIESIDAPNAYLSLIAHSFMGGHSPKMFLIENLHCMDDKTHKITNFKNVFIMNNSNVFSNDKIYNGYIFQYPNKQTSTKITREITRKAGRPPKYLPEKEENIDSDKLIQKFKLYKEQLKRQSSFIETRAIEEAIRKKQASISK